MPGTSDPSSVVSSQENIDDDETNIGASGDQARQPLDELPTAATRSAGNKSTNSRTARRRSHPPAESPERDLLLTSAPRTSSTNRSSASTSANRSAQKAADRSTSSVVLRSTPSRGSPVAASSTKAASTTPVNEKSKNKPRTPSQPVTAGSSGQAVFKTPTQASTSRTPAKSASKQPSSAQSSTSGPRVTTARSRLSNQSSSSTRTPVASASKPATTSSRTPATPASKSGTTSSRTPVTSASKSSSGSRRAASRLSSSPSTSSSQTPKKLPSCLLDKPTQVMAPGDVNAAFYPTLTREQKAEAKEAQDKDLESTNYPIHGMTPVCRSFFQLDPYDMKAEKGTGRYLADADSKCVFCTKATAENLIQCHGEMNYNKGTNPPCKSRFHWSCFKRYNAGNFLGHYAALPECHGRLVCPLHCCSKCSAEHKQQSAFLRGFTECALCLRAFHTDTCLPIGAKFLEVTCEMGDGSTCKMEMLVCPAHTDCSATPAAHLGICEFCSESGGKLKNCRSCVRSFHEACREVQTVDGKAVLPDLCEFCAIKEVIRYDVPVIALFSRDKKFYLGFAREMHLFPSAHRRDSRYDALGYVPVKWLDGSWTLVRQNELVQLNNVHLDHPGADQDLWQLILEESRKIGRFKPVKKEVCKTAPTARVFRPGSIKPYQFLNENEECQGPNRCSADSDTCGYVLDAIECPPKCGQACNNRLVSNRTVSSKIRLEMTATKGYGVFATEPIAKGEFLAEYVGEIIDRAEKLKRLGNIEITMDSEANQYFMDTLDGLCIDAARIGNIARYINHSCDPNAGSHNTRIFQRADEKNGVELYEPRAYVRAHRAIAAGEEITFNYKWEDSPMLPRCCCGTPNCTGYMGGVPVAKKDVESDDDSDDSNAPSTSRAPPPKKAKKSVVKSAPHKSPASGPSSSVRRRSAPMKCEEESDEEEKEAPKKKSVKKEDSESPRRGGRDRKPKRWFQIEQ